MSIQKGEKVYHESYKQAKRVLNKRVCKRGFSWVKLGVGCCWVLEKDCRREK